MADLWAFEKSLTDQGYSTVAGVDEAGRGPLAGPVISAAVVLPPDFDSHGITDSKKLTQRQRQTLFQRIYEQARCIGIGIVDALEIDRINILQASLLSMVIAVSNLSPRPDYLIIDGKFKIASRIPQQALIKGDSRAVSIAAASIVAKVTRDSLMLRYHEDFPEFGFERHKGYPTKAHKSALSIYGPCLIHRRSFKGVREYLPPGKMMIPEPESECHDQ
ncbi:MAG: ribonuclease HII [Desulfobacteraceae bacterium]|nr:ribonuclease HII [Desulfobacteraceae bacterium]